MTIRLYKNSSDALVVDKDLSGDKVITGTLYEETDILNPVFDIDYFDGVFEYNYAYIAAFGRYYFITKIDIIDGRRVRITCAVDVLETYWEKGLKDLTVHITRQETLGNYYLYDNRLMTTGRHHTQVKRSGPGYTIRLPSEDNVHTYVLNSM